MTVLNKTHYNRIHIGHKQINSKKMLYGRYFHPFDAQFEKIEKFLKSKRDLFDKYSEVLDSIEGIKLFKEPENSKSNYWLQTIILENGYENEFEIILENTNRNNIMTRPAWDLIHELEMYLDCPKSPLPVSKSLSKRIINIPSSAFLT